MHIGVHRRKPRCLEFQILRFFLRRSPRCHGEWNSRKVYTYRASYAQFWWNVALLDFEFDVDVLVILIVASSWWLVFWLFVPAVLLIGSLLQSFLLKCFLIKFLFTVSIMLLWVLWLEALLIVFLSCSQNRSFVVVRNDLIMLFLFSFEATEIR